MSLAEAVKSGTYRLSKLVRMPGGRTDAELLQGASSRLANVKWKMLEPFDEALDELTLVAAMADADPSEVYRKALVVSELGGVVGHERAGRAAFLLCDWIELAAADDRALRRGVAVHVDAIRALRRAQTSVAEQTTLLQGLEVLARQQRAKG